MNEILNTVLGSLPSVVALIRESHATANPGAAPLTDAEVFAALSEAVAQVIAKGEAWKAAHPTIPASAEDLGVHTGSTGD